MNMQPSKNTEKIGMESAAVNVQCKLTVGAVNDPMEAQADAVADQVMRMPENALIQRKCTECEEEEHAQRKPLASFIQKQEIKNDSSNTVASDAVSSKIQSTKGGGSPLPSTTKSFMESRFGTDFSGVRIHTNNDAVTLSSELNAQAFTVGSDIYFNSGKYTPESSNGKHLLAHELTHTIQQNGTINAMRPKIIQRATLQTNGGEWEDENYTTSVSGAQHSVAMDMKFKPQGNVNATKIGLVQIVNSVKNGRPYQINNDATVRGRSIGAASAITTNATTGETDEGFHIDQSATNNNPLYAVEGSTGTQLNSLPPNATWGEHGFRFTDSSGALQQHDAKLHDETGLNDANVNSGQIFETTAFAFEGVQTGMYYGSVRWGWRTDAAGALTKIPFQIASRGVPTSTFIKSTEIWNSGSTSAGTANIPLRAVDVKITNVNNINLNQHLPGNLPARLLPTGTRVHIMRSASPDPALAGMVFIRVVDGPHVGRDGWIPSSQLTDERA
jgi:hypothetical protein